MFRHNFLYNPIRKQEHSFVGKIGGLVKKPFIRFALWCGFLNIDYAYIHGKKSRLFIGKNCSTMNTIFNLISGTITIGDNTIFTHNCMVLTGTHMYENGKRRSLNTPPLEETPTTGRDIVIGQGCFIGSGATILGNVTIGDNVIIAAGSVVTKDVPSDCVAGGVPAKILKFHSQDQL